MNIIDTFASLPLTRAIGWTVVHFLWQGTLIAAAAGLALGLLRARSASARYAVCCVGLALMLVTPLVTLPVMLAVDGAPAAPGLSTVFTPAAALEGWHRLNPLLPWITLVWLTGFSLLQCRTLLHWTRMQRLKRTHTQPLSPNLQSAVSQLCDRIGVRRFVQVVESTVAEVPMLIGWLSPVILVPTGALCGLTHDQLRAVLAHELAHVRRHDAVVNLIQAALESLLFFHPAVWWISDCMRVEREYCCDDVAVEVSGDTLCYARALSTLEDMRGVPSPAVAANGGSLMKRIFRLVGNRADGPAGRGDGLTPMVLATSLAVLFAVLGIALSGSPAARAALEPGPEPADEASEPGTHEPVPPSEDELTDEARLRYEIARRQAALEKLQRELRQRRIAASGANGQQDADRAAARADAHVDEREHREHMQQVQAEHEYEKALQIDQRSEMEQEREALAELDRQLALERRQAAAAEHAAQTDYERALELGERSAAEQEREVLAELDSRLAFEGQRAAAAEDAARMEYARAVELGERSAAEQEREALAELDRRLALEERQAAAKRTAETEYTRALRLDERDDREAIDLERELADREAALEELNREVARLRELILLRKTDKAERKQLKREAAEEKSRLKDLKQDAKRKDKVKKVY